MRHSSIPQFVLTYPVVQPSLNRLTDVPVQFSMYQVSCRTLYNSAYPVQYVEVCMISRKFVWMQNHRNHHRDPANDVAKESGCHCSRKHLKTWFGTSSCLISSSCSFGADFDINVVFCLLVVMTLRGNSWTLETVCPLVRTYDVNLVDS